MKKEQQESCFSKPSSSTDVASRPLTAKRAPPLTNLRRFQGHAAGFLSLTHKRASIDQHGEQESRNAESGVNCSIDENSEDRFFDSQHHRCCFSLCHAKIGTFVFCTWIFHEIVLGTIYLLTRLESGTQITSRLVILLVCRLIQLPSMALLYVGLWRHHSYLLLPFAVTQENS
ncbi:hypothetical protein DdX_00148 [Ditylenchus destructor]|uniref:Uncharacterized protein n=1 Tax=Ditylenchus destructor TaxID=166010 RepID=A0AAD4R701_9BILA|nr:hypothetical protein DdX_00148 [Ditylenchus destructor]